MDELVQLLRDRLDEDEQAARAAAPGPWRQDEPERRDFVRSVEDGYVVDCSGSRAPGENAAHVARHDPARVLRDIEARRSILDDLAEVIRWGERKGPDYQDGVDACERTLKRLALPYADHPDYRAEWRP